MPELSSCTPGSVPKMFEALVPLKLARVFTGRLVASSVVNVPLTVGESVSMALMLSPVT